MIIGVGNDIYVDEGDSGDRRSPSLEALGVSVSRMLASLAAICAGGAVRG